MNEPRRYFFKFLMQKHYKKDFPVSNNGTINTMLKMLSKFRKKK